MPDFSMNVNYGQPQGQMSLGDILNVARGAQAYQQSQEMNPLALQKARMEVQQAQQLNPLAVKKATEEAQQAQIGTQQKKLELDQSHFNLAGNVLSGLEARAITLADKKDTATAMKELKAAEQWLNASGVPSQEKGAFKMAEQQLKNGDFAGYQATLENMRNILGGAASRYQANLPQTATIANAPAAFTQATGVAKPLNIQGETPQQNVGAGGQAPKGVTSTQMELQYPVRKAGDIRPLAPNEAIDTERGAKYRNDLTNRQTDLSKSRRNLDEVIEVATKLDPGSFWSSGVAGALKRTVSGWAGDTTYKQLSKDLANVQISNMQAMGGSMETDAGKQLMKMASGDETYPPDVLINIARRTYSDLTNLDMQATGAAKFAKKYGDSNLNTFKELWSKNADSKVFEAMAVYENVKDPVKRKEEIDRLLGNNPEKRQEFFQKYNNIRKLTQTGEL